MRWLFGLVALMLAVLPAPAWAARLALVIGINDYEMLPPLEKAVGDAEAMSGKLAEMGFAVTTLLDPDRRAFNQAITAFRLSLRPGDVAFVHYSGHGIEVDGRNLLLPRDMPLPASGEEDYLAEEAIDLSALMARVADSGAAARIFVIDACRDNPFARRGVRGLGSVGGLGPVAGPPRGSFILYSAGYGQTALDRLGPDDASPTSIYTRVLLERLGTPGASISEIARQVRSDVAALASAARHDQSPAYYDELTEDLVLAPAADASPDYASGIAGAFDRARALGTPGAWEAFLANHEQGVFADLARAALADLTRSPVAMAVAAPEGSVDLEAARGRLHELWDEGLAFANAGDNALALQRMSDARVLAEGYFGADSVEYADASNRLVGPLTLSARVDEAIAASRDAIAIYAGLFGAADQRVLNEKANLASRLAATGRPGEAVPLYNEVIAAFAAIEPGQRDALGYAHALEGYGQLAMRRGDAAVAEQRLAEAVAIAEASGLTGTINYGWIAAGYGRLLQQLDRCGEAQALFARAAEAMQRAGVSTSQHDYADILGRIERGCPA
ncbi:MAG: hypothetical protein EOP22_15300 [Hyphomicrobiales bacterium]|nr:MAG: hypothetical protein EOP22_15300 [Hyphomicrobiales bacterium]